ncbi:MAG: type II toxin-antitoxin system VapC family toxin [Spirochaetes bacterium]|nr:type II toxin-antitoxin system VapC family toxin [Spirochaetota bacterium]
MKAVFDTNILIDYLNADKRAKKELDLYERRLISLVTQIEILVGAKDKEDEAELRKFLRHFELCDISQEVAEFCIKLRQKKKIRIPDALIWATALHHECQLVTRNTRDFDTGHPSVRVPYRTATA